MRHDEIRRLRLALSWSQERLARELGVSFCTVNRWEKGKSNPSPMALKALGRIKERASCVNRRSYVRFELHYPMQVHIAGLKQGAKTADAAMGPFPCRTEDISLGGVMFKSPFLLTSGELLEMSLDIGDKRPVETVSQVVWATDANGEKKAGAKFHKMQSDDKDRLMQTLLTL
ncbi:MAG: PilZ domain-containing protein [Deltaproteobacteria bacterium]|nr:PilZ domain-containing protein [Deltaproteobacteria bacterium]